MNILQKIRNVEQQKLDGYWTGEEQNSTWVQYYSNGQLSYKQNWINGLRHGDDIEWNEKGQMNYKEKWKNGKKIS